MLLKGIKLIFDNISRNSTDSEVFYVSIATTNILKTTPTPEGSNS
jgi:hypothetical protein